MAKLERDKREEGERQRRIERKRTKVLGERSRRDKERETKK